MGMLSGSLTPSPPDHASPASDRLNNGLGLLGLILVAVMTSAIGWRDLNADEAAARDRARRTASVLADHAGRLFEVADIALRATTSLLGTQDWAAIGNSPRLRDQMVATAAALPYIGDIWLNDQDGLLRLTTLAFPTPASSFSNRPAFDAIRNSTGQPVIGGLIVGKLTKVPTFLIARRLAWPDGSMRGVVSATADLGYFVTYWSGLELPDEERVALLHDDGERLIDYPGDAQATSGASAGLRAAAARDPEAGSFAASAERVAFYHRVRALPLYLVVSFAEPAVFRRWLGTFWRMLPFGLAAMLGIAAALLLNDRRRRAEAQARRATAEAQAELSAGNLRLEERVAERTAELRETNAEIQRFAYVVSHDLRAPLVNITGFASELQMLRPDLFPAEMARRPGLEADFDEALGFIRGSTMKMDRLIDAILLLSRQGQRPLRPEPIDMDKLMRAIADGVAHRLQRTAAEIEIGPLPPIVGDPLGVEQIFSNLVDNAVKYLRPGLPGRIRIRGRRGEDGVIFSVEDNGRGIEPSDHVRVFDLFKRAGPQDQPGEGIGLAHVRVLVRRAGGAIKLDSALGRGSTFTVTLPSV